MTLNTGIFDVSDPQNPDRVYSAALLSRILSKHIRDGVVHGDGNEMAVTVTDPPAMSVQVGTGTAMVQGRFCENDAALMLTVPTAHATYPRIDRVVVQLNTSPGRTIDIVVKPGTAAPEPAAPALTRTAETWELSLAQIRVEAGATSILSAKITDERGSASLCGIASPAYVPSSVLEIVEGLVMQGMPLVGLPAPGSSSAAATKAYVDSVISGFGISDIAIDDNLDMGGQDITNVGSLGAASIQTTTYTLAAGSIAPCCFRDNSSVPATKTALPVPAGRSGSVYVGYNILGAPGSPTTVWLTLNEVEVPGSRHTGESGTFDQIVTVAPGDTIGLRSSGSGGNTPFNTLFEIRAYMFLRYSAQHNW